MIPVHPQPEPGDFDGEVRQKGLAWLRKQRLPLVGPLPAGTKPRAYWTACLNDLYSRYGGVCAYLAYHFERSSGAGTVEHFVPKSLAAQDIYEWANYRLATRWVNSKKNAIPLALDPFSVAPGLFHLDLFSGRIYPNPLLAKPQLADVENTIRTLGLDDRRCRDDRADHFSGYLEHGSQSFLQRMSPFVFAEALRQALL